MHFLLLARNITFGLAIGTLLAGCDSEANLETIGLQSTSSEPIEFEGTWLSGCSENRLFMVPEEDQPDGYVQSTLTIDSSTRTYDDRTMLYTDSQCAFEDPEDPITRLSSGEIVFGGLTTTSSGLEATIVRYFSGGSSPDLTGLQFRESDILYRELRQSTLIEDIVPARLALSFPWQLVI